MKNNIKDKLILLIVYVLIICSIGIRIQAEATNYISPDSKFYLRVADNIKNGSLLISAKNGSSQINKQPNNNNFSIWPIGYPLAISAVSSLTNTTSFTASKLTNFVFLGFIFLLFFHWFGKLAWFPALYFCSFSMLEVFSYTWSEGSFLFFIFLLCYIIQKDFEKEKNDKFLWLKLFLCLSALFLMRYAGIIYFFFTACFMVYNAYKKKYRTCINYLVALLLASILALAYFQFNYNYSGFYTGMDRIHPEKESLTVFFTVLIQGLVNEATIARNYYFTGYVDYLYLVLLSIQIFVGIIILKKRSFLNTSLLKNNISIQIIISSSILYLFFVIIIRKIQPFDIFDYRILAPFSAPIYIGLLATVSKDLHHIYFKNIYKWITFFMLLSLIINLPKEYILNKITNWL